MNFVRTPLERVNIKVVQEPLDGLIRNSESDLERYLNQVSLTNDKNEIIRITLLLIALRFAINSYRAVCFLLTDQEGHPKRKDEFVIVVPPIIRQLFDLWCSFIYILDDFANRVGEFQNSAWLGASEHMEKTKQRYGDLLDSPDMQTWFENMKDFVLTLEEGVPEDLVANPENIPYWPTPAKLWKKETKSQDFLKYIHDWPYDDISEEAHLQPGGLFMAGSLLLKDRATEEIRRQIETYTFHEYKARRFCLTIIPLLGIISEIEMFGNFNNKQQAVKVWSLIAAFSPDAKEVYEKRYQSAFE
jgi:hypothetical protein